jgi:hypothetical protein
MNPDTRNPTKYAIAILKESITPIKNKTKTKELIPNIALYISGISFDLFTK